MKKNNTMSVKRRILWVVLFFTIYSMLMFLYIVWCQQYRNLTIEFPQKIQEDYSQYLINKNDEFIDSMIIFEEYISSPKRVFQESELSILSKEIESQNDILVHLQKNPPDKTNSHYLELYKDILKVYAFYIQGEVMKMEYASAFRNEYTKEQKDAGLVAADETWIMGVEMCNMMGNMILENPSIINRVGGTNSESKHNIVPLEEFEASLITTPELNILGNNDKINKLEEK